MHATPSLLGGASTVEAHAVAERFVRQFLTPNAALWARGAVEPSSLFETAAEAGLLGLQVPVEKGGLALSFTDTAKVMYVLAGADFGAAMALINSHNVAKQLLRYWSTEQAARYVARLLSGKAVGCTALTEPSTGSDLAQLQTLATRSGDGWLLSGEKTWIINAAYADHVVVYAQTQVGAGVKGIAAFLVDSTAPGFEGLPVVTAPGLSSMGVGGIRLTQVYCESTQIVCPPGAAFSDIMGDINRARTYVASMCCGMVAQALAVTKAYGRQRHAFGKPLFEHQAWRGRLAEASTALQAGELLVVQACELIDQGAEVQVQAAQAKSYATNMAQTHLGALLHAMGAEGFLDSYPFMRHLSAAHAAALTDGSTAMLLERIAQDFRVKPGAD